MKYNKTLLFFGVSLLVLGNTKIVAMQSPVPHTTASSAKKISFSMITQLFSNFFIASKDEIDATIKNKEDDLIETINTLKVQLASAPQTASSVEQIINRKRTQNLVNNIKNIWNQLSYLHVSNTFEKFFNKYGPDIDELKPFITKKLSIHIHPDKNRDHVDIFEYLSKTLIIERRENPLKSMNTFSRNDIENMIHETSKKLIETKLHKSLMLTKKNKIELQKAKTMMLCDTKLQDIKNRKYLYNKEGK